MLSRYKHENIVSLLGFCDDSGEKILVYEYASKKSLDLHLNSNDLTWNQRLKICVGAARGLAYLHDYGTTQQRILHRDIKSSNILLDETWNARISDFGLSKFAPANQQISFMISNGVGTIGYCDPIYVETGLLTQESDVYSFGVVLFEVLCGRLCIGNNNDKRPPLPGLARQCYKQNKLNEIIYGNIKDEIDSDSLKAFSTIAYQCLKRDIEERPLMAEVVRVLESALEHQTWAELEEIAFAEADEARLKQKVAELHHQLNQHHSEWKPGTEGLQYVRNDRLKEEEENSKPRVAYTIVEIIEASHMRLADPYVKGQLGPHKFRTKPQKKTSSPKWLEEFMIPIHTWKSPNALMIEIWDKNFFIDDILSNCSITINDFKDGQRHDIWVPLQNVTTGRLHLAITVVEVDKKKRGGAKRTDAEGGGSAAAKGAAVPEAEVAVETGKLVHFEGTMGFTVDDLMRATGEIMGKSTYWTVYKATWEDGDQVALKRLREKITKNQREFGIEVNLLGKIRHPNLLAMRAYYFVPKGETLLVFDYMPKGSLATFLHARGPETPVDWPTRMQIMKGMARGLLSLHNHHNIIHGNLTSSNILLDENVNPKIDDFGLSRLITAAANSKVIATAGALGYRAPELSKLKKANTKTDIYSVGVIMLELLTGKSPGEAMNGVDLPQWVASIVKEEWTYEVFDFELMKDASAIGEELNTLKLALHCVDPSPSARPEVQLVLQQLEEIRPETATSSGDDGGAGPSMSE